LVDGEGIVRHCDRGARDLLGTQIEGKNLGRLAPASGLEAFVRDARTEAREGFRFDLPERGGRAGRSYTAAVVPLVSLPGSRDPQMRVVLLLDATRRRVASELMRAMESVIPRREVGVLREAARLTFAPATLVGQSPAMQRARAQAIEATQTRATVFVHGPEASGKEHVARAVHFGGETDGPFLPVNCAGLSEQNLESELFGQVKGASADALTDRPGALQQANHGTLYLQNVTALTPDLQERLLQALREGKVQRAGSKRVERVEVRVVASDPKDLGNEGGSEGGSEGGEGGEGEGAPPDKA
jgi:hypothetical protein